MIATATQNKIAPVETNNSLLIQRKCSCGTDSKLSGQCYNCKKKKLLGVQAKLRIGSENDVYEQEADRIAELVINMPYAQVNNRLTLSAAPAIQTKKVTQNNSGGYYPTAVNRVPGSSGTPMDSVTRTFMEQRFGQNFSTVRIHNDTEANRSARAINAKAYTTGNNIVFGAGHFSANTAEGKRLLAHELTHVLQQRTMPLTIRRDAETNVTVQAPESPPECGIEQHGIIAPAVQQAGQWLEMAVSGLDTYIANPGDAASAATRNALDRHFHTGDTSTARTLRDRLDLIRNDLRQRGNPANPDPQRQQAFTVECHDETDELCEVANAYVSNYHTLVFCPIFFNRFSPLQRASSVIHEMAHALIGLNITDRAYSYDRLLPFLNTAEALDNAESYAMYVQEISTGNIPATNAPTDEIDDECSEQTNRLARIALARAERWNRRANTTMRRTSYAAVITRQLGDATPATRTAAATKYKKMGDRFKSPISVRCSADNCGSRVAYKQEEVNRRGLGAGIAAGIGAIAGAVLGGVFLGIAGGIVGGLLGGALGALIGLGFGALASSGAAINLCPSWAGQATEGDRVESLLVVAYELYADGSSADSVKYAALAREIYETRFPPTP